MGSDFVRNRLSELSVVCTKVIPWICLFLVFFLVEPIIPWAQNISGVINRYAKVLDIDTCANSMIVEDVSGFSAGDRVLIIQMKGAVIDESNTTSFGTILNYSNAGNYEFGNIGLIQGLQITLQNKIIRVFDAAKGSVQIVRVPQYKDVIVSAPLLAKPWDRFRGGILVLEASGSVTLNSNVDVSGMGFLGGDSSENSAAPFDSDYYNARLSSDGGEKGESIAARPLGKEAGRGPLANGGGGGNNQNGGGGGGSNAGKGGVGGDQTELRGRFVNGGLGGRVLDYTTQSNRIFFGGGGGGGHENDGRGTPGGNGGGIVIIRTPLLIGGGGKIISDGLSAHEAGSDGAGGGGAGGTIVLDVNTITNNPALFADGGTGGNNNADTLPNYCYAPGGGGSGGRIVVKGPSIPPSSVKGGAAGVVTAPNLACKGTTYGASDGEKGGGTWDNIITDESQPFTFPKLIANRDTICEGDTIQFSLLGAHQYIWTPVIGLDNASVGNPKASPPSTTKYTVSYLDDRNCPFSDTLLLIVNPRPKPVILGSLDVCSDQTFFYKITSIANASYIWTVVGGVVITGQGTEDVGVQWGASGTGTLEVTVTPAGTSCSGKAIITINISPAISAKITGVKPICEGDTLTLYATPGYASYRWSNGDSLQNINVTKAGNYFVKTVSTGGCTTFSDTVSILVNPKPIVTIIPSAPVLPDTGSIDTLTLSGIFAGYKWGTGETSDTLFVVDSGTYFVSVVDTNGCTASAQIHITRDLSPPKITIALDTIEAAPCEAVSFPVHIVYSLNLPPSGSTDYTMEITFEKSLLAPLDKTLASVIKGRWRTLTVTGVRPDNQIDGVLKAIGFTAALGDTVETEITIETFAFTNGKKVLIKKYNGLFRLTKLCKEGGTRLFSETDTMLLMQNRPNPANSLTTISFTLIEEGNSKLWLTDVLGRRIQTLLDDPIKPGAYQIQVNSTLLPVGNYFYILQTPTSVKRRMMRVER